MKPLIVSKNNIQKHLDALSKIGNLGPNLDDGFLRASWSNEESKAFAYIKQVAKNYEFFQRYDDIGNMYMRSGIDNPLLVQVGSHLDTVPEGGNYDGTAGIVAGIEAIKAIKDINHNLTKDFELVVWRGEESATFDTVYKGSKGAFGMPFNSNILAKTFNGKTLEDAIVEQGFDPSYFRYRKATITQDMIDNISAHIELHIEQGKKLETDMTDIGIVTSIRGPDRYRIIVRGEFDHSGATPMGVKYRRDANLAIAYMQVELDKLSSEYIADGYDFVQTVGELNSNLKLNSSLGIYDNAMTKVSGIGYFTFEVRSNDIKFREKYTSKAKELITTIAKTYNVDADIQSMGSDDPVNLLDKNIQTIIESSSNFLNYSFVKMPSGAGHDSAIVSKQKRTDGPYIPVGMIFIPCKNGINHNKKEFAKTEDIFKGANVLANTLYQLAR